MGGTKQSQFCYIRTVKIFSFIVIVLIFFSCKNKFEVEDQLLSCLKNKYQEKGINLDEELKSFEEVLILGNEVPNKNGVSYFNLYNDLIRGGKLKKITPDHYETKLDYNIGLDSIEYNDCIDLESQFYKNSKSYELDLLIDSVLSERDINAEKFSKLIREVLDDEALNHPYFKARNLILISSQVTKDQGLFQLLPEKSNDIASERIKLNFIINVFVREDGLILLNNSVVKIDQLSDSIKVILENEENENDWPEHTEVTMDELVRLYNQVKTDTTESGAKKKAKASIRIEAKRIFKEDFKKTHTVINLSVSQGTSYTQYVKVKEAIREAYKKMRIELSGRYFGKNSWNELSIDEKSMLKIVVEERISEAPVSQ